MVTVRAERAGDEAAIRQVNEQAFGSPDEADLVDALREDSDLTVSLVALSNKEIVGHIAFSPISLESGRTGRGPGRVVGLAPMAVLPSHQRQGIGLQLIQAGLEACRRAGDDLVLVLGHPDYYPRSGFVPAKPHGFEYEFDGPDEAFMVIELREGALTEYSGRVRFHPAFDGF